MKRRMLKLFLLLLLGAIVNVAVAWGCRLLAPKRILFDRSGLYEPPNPEGYLRAELSFGLVRTSQSGPGIRATFLDFPTQVTADEFRALIPSVSTLANNAPLTDWSMFWSEECFAGWPFLSFHGSHTLVEMDGFQSKTYGVFDLAKLMSTGEPHTELPYYPLWPGFAINTIFYAAILWLLFAAPGSVRRRLRIRRGVCPACAYPVGQSPTCTECGANVHLSRARQEAVA
jgi:hypothetical protein